MNRATLNAQDVLREAQSDGLTLSVDGGKLIVRGDAAARQKWRPTLLDMKPAILAALAERPASNDETGGDRLHMKPLGQWPLDDLRSELEALREVYLALVKAGCPPHSLQSCEAEALRFKTEIQAREGTDRAGEKQ